MNTLNLELFNIKELSNEELKANSAGASFPYRVGQFLRFEWINATEGYGAAVGDLVVTELQN